MPSIEDDVTKTLKSEIKARKQLIRRIVNFAFALMEKIGVEVSRKVGSSNTNVIQKIDDFNGFSFYLDTGMSLMGGNELSIQFRNEPVFKVYWQPAGFSADDCEVKVFEPDGDWQERLEKTIRRKSSILARLKREKKADASKTLAESAKGSAVKKLEEEANRLGL